MRLSQDVLILLCLMYIVWEFLSVNVLDSCILGIMLIMHDHFILPEIK